MQLVEQHVISKNDPRYTVIDKATFASKNLYNAALYEIRQFFIHKSIPKRLWQWGRGCCSTSSTACRINPKV